MGWGAEVVLAASLAILSVAGEGDTRPPGKFVFWRGEHPTLEKTEAMWATREISEGPPLFVPVLKHDDVIYFGDEVFEVEKTMDQVMKFPGLYRSGMANFPHYLNFDVVTYQGHHPENFKSSLASGVVAIDVICATISGSGLKDQVDMFASPVVKGGLRVLSPETSKDYADLNNFKSTSSHTKRFRASVTKSKGVFAARKLVPWYPHEQAKGLKLILEEPNAWGERMNVVKWLSNIQLEGRQFTQDVTGGVCPESFPVASVFTFPKKEPMEAIGRLAIQGLTGRAARDLLVPNSMAPRNRERPTDFQAAVEASQAAIQIYGDKLYDYIEKLRKWGEARFKQAQTDHSRTVQMLGGTEPPEGAESSVKDAVECCDTPESCCKDTKSTNIFPDKPTVTESPQQTSKPPSNPKQDPPSTPKQEPVSSPKQDPPSTPKQEPRSKQEPVSSPKQDPPSTPKQEPPRMRGRRQQRSAVRLAKVGRRWNRRRRAGRGPRSR